ncbi:hypothetical protein [uncultured Mediterranean phage]|nr:hypothetical protein [uncultured Mediterranean phage]|tara:strand:- start:3855 stop:5072 length:1218 start_codon:yes stop_codon:yes gene_type:complete
MFAFASFLTEQKNLHMEHLEDEVLNGGVEGTRGAINFLQGLRDMLAGSSASSVDVTVKWDGAPAVFAGINPENDQFFVGTKGVFAKNAKINYTDTDIDNNHSGGLAEKLKVALKELSKVNIQGVLQGDMMYTHNDITKETIDGEPYITFQPNTIVYAIPVKSKLAAKILSSNMGIVWHTTYSGDTMEDMTASFGVSSGAFSESSSVWQADASFKDHSGSATMTSKETGDVTKILSQAGKLFREIDSNTLAMVAGDPTPKELIKTYNNKMVREGQKISNPKRHTAGVIKFVYDKLKADVDKVKRENTKKEKQRKMDLYVDFFRKHSSDLVKIFALQNLLIDAKLIILRKLEQVKSIKTLMKTSTGFKVTSPEGFVAIDKLKGGAVKLVDRMEFSMQNFNAAKNWDK